MTDTDLIIEHEIDEKSFKSFKVPMFDNCTKIWQKRYRDKNGIKYYLEVRYYDLVHPTTKEDLSGYEVSGQFYLKGNHKAVNMTFLDSTISEVEEVIDKMFETGQLEYYELY